MILTIWPKTLIMIMAIILKLTIWKDVDLHKGVDRGGDYDDQDKIDDISYGHIDLEGALGSNKEYMT